MKFCFPERCLSICEIFYPTSFWKTNFIHKYSITKSHWDFSYLYKDFAYSTLSHRYTCRLCEQNLQRWDYNISTSTHDVRFPEYLNFIKPCQNTSDSIHYILLPSSSKFQNSSTILYTRQQDYWRKVQKVTICTVY